MMIGLFLIALIFFFIIAFIIIFKKRKAEDLSEIESTEEISDSLPLMTSEIIADDNLDSTIPDAVDLTPNLSPEDQGDLNASTTFAVASGAEYLTQEIPDATTDIPENPDNSGSNSSSSSSSYDSGSSNYNSGSSSSYDSGSSGKSRYDIILGKEGQCRT